MFYAGEKLTASTLNAAVGAAWTTYTPTWTGDSSNPSIGNGTLTGAWTKIGITVMVRVSMLPGSTTTFGSGFWSFALPEAAATVPGLGANSLWVGLVYVFDSGTANRVGVCHVKSGGTAMTMTDNGGGDTFRSTVPQTWANGDYLVAQISYESYIF
ncbi:hypothetical protein [Lentzea aerocolonigenes]|uniref:hypothetical protein n=1 Tax=Lentzea aerocolonigenes TaxID=68170 RepID=UPI0006966ACC|nr:hypothetical protein [Lentzea aerocolonigenes]